MDNLGLLSSFPFQNVLLPCSPLMYSALMMASLYGCRCFMCKKNGLKRSMANCESQSNDFTLSKCRRLDNDSSLCQLNDHTSSNGRKCAGTQTLFSSFVPLPSLYQQPPGDAACLHDISNENEPRFILDLDRHMARLSSQPHSVAVHAGLRRVSPPVELESSNAPLNLTLSSAKSNVRSVSEQNLGQWALARDPPYVLRSDRSGLPTTWKADEHEFARCGAVPGASTVPTNFCKSTAAGRAPAQHRIWVLSHDTAQPSAKTKQQGSSQRKVTSVVTVECERDIEEHFQRSLGKDYPKCLANAKHGAVAKSAASTPMSSTAVAHSTSALETSKANVTISGAVDDHFAKSLGQTWTKIKSQNSQTDFKPPPPGSVDDHFAKALGEAWYKLRVKKEGT